MGPFLENEMPVPTSIYKVSSQMNLKRARCTFNIFCEIVNNKINWNKFVTIPAYLNPRSCSKEQEEDNSLGLEKKGSGIF